MLATFPSRTSFLLLTLFWLSSQVPCAAIKKDLDASTLFALLDTELDSNEVADINANFYKLYSADFTKTDKLLAQALERSNAMHWQTLEAYTYLHLGVVHYLSGSYVKAYDEYLKALRVFETKADKKGMAATYNELSVFYNKQKDSLHCRQSLDKAESLSREIGDYELLGTSLGNRGAILATQGRLVEAAPYFLEVYTIRKNSKDSIGLGYVLLDLAELAMQEGQTDVCMAYIDSSTLIRERIGDAYGVVVNMVVKGEMNLKARRFAEAATWLKKGIEQSRKIGYPDLTKQALDLLSQTELGLSDPQAALLHHLSGDTIKDSLLAIEKNKAVKELQIQYETEKKEIQLAEQKAVLQRNQFIIGFLCLAILSLLSFAIVWRKNTVAKRDRLLALKDKEFQEELNEALLQSQEQERKRMAADLHDGLGQHIAWLYRKLDHQDAKDSDSLQVVKHMHQDIRNIAFDLMPHALVSDGLQAALKELFERLKNSTDITFNLFCDAHFQLPNKKTDIALYRVCQEWISNALKHGNTRKIELSLTRNSDSYNLVIECDGDGFDPAVVKTGPGHGWKNMLSRVQSIKGELFLESTPGIKGSTLVIELPLFTDKSSVKA